MLVASLLWFSIVFPRGSLAQSSPSQAIYSLLQTRQYAQAEAAAREYLLSSPNDCSVQTMLGLALRAEGRMEPAYQSFRAAMKLCPQSLPALEGAVEIAYARRLPEAEDLLTQLLQLRPQDSTAHAMLGAIEARSGNCASSVDNYAKGFAQVRQSPAALREYAGCLVVLARAPEAVPVLTQLLALQESTSNREMLARAQMDAGQHTQALATLQPLLGADSKEDAALLLGAQIAEADNNTPQAIAWLRQAMQAAPKRVENYLYFAEISFNHGSYQVGVDFLNLGLREAPGNARLYVARGVLEVQLGKTDAGLTDFEEAHRLDPKLSFAEDAMGVLFSQKHDMSAALALFEQKSKQQPNDPLLQYLYAETLSEAAASDNVAIESAITAARRAITLESSYQPARDLLCSLLRRHGDLQAVVDEAAEATRRDPYDEAALYQALLAERRLKHPEKTADLLRRLQEAKAHNQAAVTKYVLQEDGADTPEK